MTIREFALRKLELEYLVRRSSPRRRSRSFSRYGPPGATGPLYDLIEVRTETGQGTVGTLALIDSGVRRIACPMESWIDLQLPARRCWPSETIPRRAGSRRRWSVPSVPVLDTSFPCGSRERDGLLPSIGRSCSRAGVLPRRFLASGSAVSLGPGKFHRPANRHEHRQGSWRSATGCRLIGSPQCLGGKAAAAWYQDAGEDGSGSGGKCGEG